MNRYVIYVAGPFRARKVPGSQWEQTQNIRRAEEASLEVWRAGHVAICPHLNTLHFQGELPDTVWLEGDLDIVKRCDGVLLVEGWRQSEGALREAQVAEENGIPAWDDLSGLITMLVRKERGE